MKHGTGPSPSGSAARLGRLLQQVRQRAGMTQQGLADAVGCSKAQLSLMESGQRRISAERARAIEHALHLRDRPLTVALQWAGVPARVQLELEQQRAASQALAGQLRRAVRSADPVRALRRLVEVDGDAPSRALVNALGGSAPAMHDAGVLPLSVCRMIPLINRVAAGYPTEFTDLDYPARIADEYVACPDLSDPDAFAARVVGDSMTPEYREGDIVVFSPSVKTVPGSDCFVRLERDAQTTFKRVYFEDDGRVIRLQPLNNAYAPTFLPREDIAGLYAAAYVMRKVRAG